MKREKVVSCRIFIDPPDCPPRVLQIYGDSEGTDYDYSFYLSNGNQTVNFNYWSHDKNCINELKRFAAALDKASEETHKFIAKVLANRKGK